MSLSDKKAFLFGGSNETKREYSSAPIANSSNLKTVGLGKSIEQSSGISKETTSKKLDEARQHLEKAEEYVRTSVCYNSW